MLVCPQFISAKTWEIWRTINVSLLLQLQQLALLFRIREVLGSNLGRGANFSDRFLVGFFSSCSQIPREYLKLRHDLLFPHPFQFIIHCSSFHSTKYILTNWKQQRSIIYMHLGSILFREVTVLWHIEHDYSVDIMQQRAPNDFIAESVFSGCWN
jgi:hypothetical protein